MTMLTLLTSCAVTYDATADQQITTLTQDINQQFTTWIVATTDHVPVKYDPDAYSKIEGEIVSLGMRLQASPDFETRRLALICTGTGRGPENLSQQPSLQNQVEQLRTIHQRQASIQDPYVLTAALQSFDAQLGAMTTYELSLKSGSSPFDAGTAAKKVTPTHAAAGQ